jgi:4-amino-4-deoxychorismate lyase
MAVRGGRALNWAWHLRRLAADCERLKLACPEESVLRQEVARVAGGDAIVKVLVTRGAGGRGYAIPENAAATRTVAAFPPAQYDPALARDGVRVRRCALVLSEQPRLAGVKTLNRLENVLARSEWNDPAVSEGLLADAAGRVIEGTMSNLFVARAGVVTTPDLARSGVVGAQRERVRELLAGAGFQCRVADVTWEDVERSDEVFLTNSLIGAWPVTRMDGRAWPVGQVTRRVQALIEAQDANA